MSRKPNEIDEYIDAFDKPIQERLQAVRQAIKEQAPQAHETINYGIPTFKLNGKNLVHFAAFKKHIGFYATPSGHEAFKAQLSKYKQGKGSVQFPHSAALPIDLIEEIVRFRVEEINSKFKI